MIRKFIDRLLGKTPAADDGMPPGVSLGQRVEYGADQHKIDLKLVAEPAVRVVKTLQDAGYEAYIVGGAVRDLLVGLRPKDFDVATNATPEQVKGAVPPRLHRRPPLPPRARDLRPRPRARADRGVHLPRLPRQRRGRGTPSRATRRPRAGRARRQEPRRRRQRPRAARQRVGPADRGRRAARLHRQRDVLRPADADRRRLPRRHGRLQGQAAAHDRRPGNALPRRPGAHHPRAALRGQDGLQDRGQVRGSDPRR